MKLWPPVSISEVESLDGGEATPTRMIFGPENRSPAQNPPPSLEIGFVTYYKEVSDGFVVICKKIPRRKIPIGG